MAEKKSVPRYKKDNYKPLANEDPTSSDVFFNQVLDRFHIDLDDVSSQVVVHWKTLVEPAVADHSKCEKIKDGVLYLTCDHPSRASYIRLNSREIIKSIRSVFPEIELKKIITRVKNAT
ncbi:MAG: DUF721 domain-containing protein [Spirochaetales bacterium]|jgi:predicted trehalose synthase|nr:DUF721 domain-containing protein [Spirochaetales bacterium]MBR1582733.1 DUF721 domain-containing protein [Spirochaetales bacterium]